MASAIAILFVGISFMIVPLSAEFSTVECQSSTGHSGQPSKLDCVVKPQNDLTILKVFWKKDGQQVLTFDGSINPENGRFQFADTNWTTSKNISLLVKDTKVSDEGIYSCTVASTRGVTKGYAILHVKGLEEVCPTHGSYTTIKGAVTVCSLVLFVLIILLISVKRCNGKYRCHPQSAVGPPAHCPDSVYEQIRPQRATSMSHSSAQVLINSAYSLHPNNPHPTTPLQ